MALTGNLSETPLVDLIQFYCLNRETVAVKVKPTRPAAAEAIFYLERGELVDARFGNQSGLNALREGLKLREGAFRVEHNLKSSQRTIFETWNKVLLEETWRQDEEGRRTGSHAAAPPKLPSSTSHTLIEEDSMGISPPSTKGPTGSRSAIVMGGHNDRRLRRNVLFGAAGLSLLCGSAGLYFHLTSRPELPAVPTANAMPAPVPAPQAAIPPANPLPLVQGVYEKEIVFGQAVPLTGAAKELGRQMKTGVDVAFAGINESGGINGRKLRLVSLDDGYEPAKNQVVMKDLAENQKVFGFIGNVGTPTAAVAIPYALEKKMLFFGAFTGAPLLRKDPPDRYVFNYRASYAEETAAAVRYLIEVKRVRPWEIAVFAQNDKYGDAGFEGVARTLRRYKRDPNKILRVGYERNSADVHEAVNEILRNLHAVRAVVMVPTYKPAAQFVVKLKDKGANLIFTSVSFVGSNAFAEELTQLGKGYAEGVIVTQVVPLPDSKSTAVMRYHELLQKFAPGEKPDFVSLEGYIAGTLLAEAVKRAGPELNTEGLVNTLEGIRGLDMGLGAQINYGPSEHQASHKVWGSVMDAKGVYQPLELD